MKCCIINFIKNNVRTAQWVMLLFLIALLIVPGECSRWFIFISLLFIVDIVVQLCKVRRAKSYLLFEMVLYGGLIWYLLFVIILQGSFFLVGLNWEMVAADLMEFVSFCVISLILCVILLLLVILFFDVIREMKNHFVFIAKFENFFKRPGNLLISIISLPILLLLGCVVFVFCVFGGMIFVLAVVYPITDKFIPEKVYSNHLIVHEYKIVKFNREFQDVWGERDYIWHIRFPKGFNSVHAIPITSDTVRLEFGTQKVPPDELDGVSADSLVDSIVNSVSGSDCRPQQGIVYVNQEPDTTRRVYYVPGEKPEDLFIEYISR